MKSKLFHWVLMTCVSATLAGGFVPARAGVSDAWVSTKVKMLLMNSPQVSGLPIDVDTDEGRVTLHGMVTSAAEKTEAGRIARASTGATSVRNLLQVVPASQRKRVDLADDRVRDAVKAVLEEDAALESSSIQVKSVNKGVVLLDGKATTLSDHLLALELTSAVPGVRQVASEIVSPDEFGDREVWFEPAPADPVAGNRVTDAWITAQTKMRFMTDAEVPAGDINVDTRRGVVTLFGTVPSSAVSDRAIQIAKEVTGVTSVKPELRVVAASQKKLATADDGRVAAAVRARISEAKLEGSDVQVDVKAGTARLSGTVQHASHRYAAVSIAHATPGVARVQNDLRIEGPRTSQR